MQKGYKGHPTLFFLLLFLDRVSHSPGCPWTQQRRPWTSDPLGSTFLRVEIIQCWRLNIANAVGQVLYQMGNLQSPTQQGFLLCFSVCVCVCVKVHKCVHACFNKARALSWKQVQNSQMLLKRLYYRHFKHFLKFYYTFKCISRICFLGTGEITQQVKCLLCKHENLSLGHQHPHKSLKQHRMSEPWD